MPSLTDIAPIKRPITVQGVQLQVGGLSAMGIAHLLRKFPEFRKLISGMSVDITPELIMERAPDAIKSIIAAGCGEYTEEAEAAAEALPLEDQLSLLMEILEATMPSGVGPFMEKAQGLYRTVSGGGAASSGAGGKGQVTKSPSPSKN